MSRTPASYSPRFASSASSSSAEGGVPHEEQRLYYGSESSGPPSPIAEEKEDLEGCCDTEADHSGQQPHRGQSRFWAQWASEVSHDGEMDKSYSGEGSSSYGLSTPRKRATPHKRKVSDFHHSLTNLVVPLRRRVSETIAASSRKPQSIRILLRAVIALVSLLIISAMLPYSSPLSIWRWAGSPTYDSVSGDIDWRNQKFASGKGWGWKQEQEGVPTNDTMASKAESEYNFAYGGVEAEAAAAATSAAGPTYPDIPCQLDVAAFAHHYKLTPQFKYTRRYVTAKPQAPSADKPNDYDPIPRDVAEPIVKEWQTLSWRGVDIDEACKGLSGRRWAACVDKETNKRVKADKTLLGRSESFSRGQEGAASSRAEIVARQLQDEKFDMAQKQPLQKEQLQNGQGQPGRHTGSAAAALVPQRPTRLSQLGACSSSKKPLELPTYPVPRTRTQPHHIILGLATDVHRVFDMLPVLAYSFAYSNLHLVLNVPKDYRIPELRKLLRAKGIRATIILSPEEDYLRRWVELPSLLLDFADSETRFGIVADDDTYFLSMPKLFKMLDKYDYTKSVYIGALTDDWRQADSGMIAYGGAGVVLSMPLLEELQPHWGECKQSTKPGDYRLANCIYAHTHTRLSIEWGLHQTDLWDDIRGMLESGRDIISWHHWKSWNQGMDPILMARAGGACGSECLLQRFLSDSETEHEKYLLVHGLSLTLHPTPLPDFGKTEVTWKVWANSDFSQSAGPTRPRIREGRPLLGRLRAAASAASGNPYKGSTGGRWKETWLLEDVRLDEELGPATSWDNDGRGVREIYIKRANRRKGYVDAGMFDATSRKNAGVEDVDDDSDSDVMDAEGFDKSQTDEDKMRELRHKELTGTIKGLVGKLLGSSVDEEQQAEIVRQEVEEEEQDSVIELVWV